ncbi:SAM-dependent methyltransferase [Emydomyces testavorans]|uniref:SAM-dependent methyltransferase n=1 Tax=Emydomyces testavorans TaxID=2070801 RepID=A0AAF0DG03_9EURO|nr:SAM-dependent methyltransferase [Emydomyces testavorans]
MGPPSQRSKRKGKASVHKPVNRTSGKSTLHSSKTREDEIPTLEEEFPCSALPLSLQQLILNVFRSALLPIESNSTSQASCSSLTEHIQAIKAHLYRRDFVRAFAEADECALRAYALRWSASRALGYASVFWRLQELIFGEKWVDVLCVGGGAGAEIMALAGVWRAVREERDGLSGRLSALEVGDVAADDGGGCEERQTLSPGSLGVKVMAVDIADWSTVVERLSVGIRSKSVPSTRSCPAPLLPWIDDDSGENSAFNVQFRKEDVLSLSEEDIKTLLYPSPRTGAVSATTLVTLMFTLNELFSTSIPKTVSFLLRLTDLLKPGAILLIVDSPGSYSTVSLGSKSNAPQQTQDSNDAKQSSERKYPMRFLLEHTLLSAAAGKWKCMLSDESRWFRRDRAALTYDAGEGIGLEDMRYQIHLYARL